MQIFSLGLSPLSLFRNWFICFVGRRRRDMSTFHDEMGGSTLYTLFMLRKLWVLIGILKKVGWPAGNDHCPLSKTEFFLHSLQLQIWPASLHLTRSNSTEGVEVTASCTNITTNMPPTYQQVKCDLETIFCWQFAASVVAANQPILCSQTAAAAAVQSLCTLLYPSTALLQKQFGLMMQKIQDSKKLFSSDCCN